MQRTALCRACLHFVTAPQSDLLMALRTHVLEQADTHHMSDLTCVDLDGHFEALMERNRPWSPALVGL
jgi:hypothetical protein